jgi:DNA-binding XRE family transcriptional regulator
VVRYPAKVTKEGDKTVAIFRFADGSECATEAGPGESIEEMALDALVGRLKVYLDEGEAPPRPPKRAPRGDVVWVHLPLRIRAALGIRWARERVGVTQSELAKRMDVSQQAIAKLEGLRANPTLETVEKVNVALGTDVLDSESFHARR